MEDFVESSDEAKGCYTGVSEGMEMSSLSAENVGLKDRTHIHRIRDRAQVVANLPDYIFVYVRCTKETSRPD
jgi:hypothetical protein